jgi:hypothetical protein
MQSLLVQVSSRDTALVYVRTVTEESKAWQSILTGIIWPPAHWQVDGGGGGAPRGWGEKTGAKKRGQ